MLTIGTMDFNVFFSPLRASPPVGCNGHANGGWAGAKYGARSRVPATPPPKNTPDSLQRLANPNFGIVCRENQIYSKIFFFAVKKWSRQGSGNGSVFGANRAPLAVAALPVGPKPGQGTWFPPLAYASQPTVEML